MKTLLSIVILVTGTLGFAADESTASELAAKVKQLELKVKALEAQLGAAPAPASVTWQHDPSELFVRVYMDFKKAEELASKNSVDDAIQAYKATLEQLTVIRERYPLWNPAIVEFRQKKVAEALKRLSP
jgi:hypothetical protein